MDLFEKEYNGYKFVYMGNKKIKVFHLTVNPKEDLILDKTDSSLIFANFPTEEKEQLYYEKIYYSDFINKEA